LCSLERVIDAVAQESVPEIYPRPFVIQKRVINVQELDPVGESAVASSWMAQSDGTELRQLFARFPNTNFGTARRWINPVSMQLENI